jgi:hypothetical protein
MNSRNRLWKPITLNPNCPNCGKLQILSDSYRYYRGDIVCVDCKCRYYIEFEGPYGQYLKKPPKVLETPDKIDPKLLAGLMVPVISKELYTIFLEAAKCLAAGAPKGAAVLCRYAVQLALSLNGIPDKRPEEMVNIAAARTPPLLSPLAVNQCKAAAFIGGKAAHPQLNWIENIGPDDAKQALLVTKRVLLELFNPKGLTSQ